MAELRGWRRPELLRASRPYVSATTSVVALKRIEITAVIRRSGHNVRAITDLVGHAVIVVPTEASWWLFLSR